MKDKKKDIYVFFKGGDSQVDDSGKFESVMIPAHATGVGGRYEINAGVQAKVAVFYGTMWYDNDANDLMDKDEERVLRNPLTLLRTEDGAVEETVQEKKTGGSSGTYEMSLEKSDLDNAYKYFVEFRLPQDYTFVTRGDSQVDEEGRGMQIRVARGRRYKVNAGIRPSNIQKRPFLIFTARKEGDKKLGSQPYTYETPVGISLLKNVGPDCQPEGFTTFNGHVYFSSNCNSVLWKTDLTRNGTDIVPGSESAQSSFIKAFKDSLFFFGYHKGFVLMVLRGTPDATPSILARLGDETFKTYDSGFTEYQGSLYFTTHTPAAPFSPTDTAKFGTQLWKTDGTKEGTKMIKEIEADDYSARYSIGYPRDLTVYKDKLYFIHQPIKSRRELWVSDGTREGTMIADGVYTYYWLNSLMVMKDKLYYFVKSEFPGPTAYVLWEYDGNVSKWIKDFPYIADELDKSADFDGAPLALTVLDDKMFFAATVNGTSIISYKLWVTDGSYEGTNVVKDDLYVGPIYASSQHFLDQVIKFDNRLFFVTASDLWQGRELWVTDGSEAGTELIKDISVDAPASAFVELTVCKGRLYFVFAGSQSKIEQSQWWSRKIELWSTDGTADGTVNLDGDSALLLPRNYPGILHCFDETQ